MTPFGFPVVPEVNWMLHASSILIFLERSDLVQDYSMHQDQWVSMSLVSVYEEVPDFTLDLQIPKYEGQENCWK